MKTLKFVATVNIEDPIAKDSWETYHPDGTLTGNRTTTLSNTVLLEDNDDLVAMVDGKTYSRTDMFNEFFKTISGFFKDEHYFRVNGKPLVVLQNPHKLYSKDCKAFYDAIRRAVKEYSGEDMYLVAKQDAWTPPARFEVFYKNAVDAVTHKNMYNQSTWDRSLFYPQAIYLNWEYSREYFRDNWNGTDYIPTGAVAFNGYVDNGNYDKSIVDFDGDTFRTMCQVMKNQAGRDRIVFIDSFNQIQYSSFLESTKKEYGNGFGTLFLDIVKEQFHR
ncbi:MAG: glycoside hydrolase family 99-like domain-containing protein [Bacteroides sp.]|nr:glycoside hydrolase family 99-like domain-containing protein [Bacteroides sp.]